MPYFSNAYITQFVMPNSGFVNVPSKSNKIY